MSPLWWSLVSSCLGLSKMTFDLCRSRLWCFFGLSVTAVMLFRPVGHGLRGVQISTLNTSKLLSRRISKKMSFSCKLSCFNPSFIKFHLESIEHIWKKSEWNGPNKFKIVNSLIGSWTLFFFWFLEATLEFVSLKTFLCVFSQT